MRAYSLGIILALAAVAPAGADAEADSILASGRFRGITAPHRIAIMHGPLEGTLDEISLQEGQRVKCGEHLATIDDRVARASVAIAQLRADGQGRILLARATLDSAQADLDDLTEMRDRSAANPRELRRLRAARDEAHAAMALAVEEQEIAKATLVLEQARLAEHRLEAPFEGRVLRIHAERGTMVSDSVPIVEIGVIDLLTAEIAVSTDHYGELIVGTEYPLWAGSPINHLVHGRLRFIDPVLDAAAGTFRCVFDIANPNERYPVGVTISLDVATLTAMNELRAFVEDCP